MPAFERVSKFKTTTEYDVERNQLVAKIQFQIDIDPQDLAELAFLQTSQSGGMSIAVTARQMKLSVEGR